MAVDVATILGQPCKPTWTLAPPPVGWDYARWVWDQTIKSPPIAVGQLNVIDQNTRKLGAPRTFRILCNREIAVVHPDDAGWLVRAVEPYMRGNTKPVWAQFQKTTLANSLVVEAGLFSWLPGSWTCPECWPKPDKTDECFPDCSVQKIYGGPSDSLRKTYGYDPRAMLPWASNISNIPNCGKGGPGGPDTLCMPVDGFCKLLVSATTYTAALWQTVAQAVNEYNRTMEIIVAYPIPTFDRPLVDPVFAGDAPAPTPVQAKIPVPKRATNFYPLLAAALGAGILSVFLARR